jgi:hypothetical protein
VYVKFIARKNSLNIELYANQPNKSRSKFSSSGSGSGCFFSSFLGYGAFFSSFFLSSFLSFPFPTGAAEPEPSLL